MFVKGVLEKQEPQTSYASQYLTGFPYINNEIDIKMGNSTLLALFAGQYKMCSNNPLFSFDLLSIQFCLASFHPAEGYKILACSHRWVAMNFILKY